jgi:uncharacterized membrane protein YeiH
MLSEDMLASFLTDPLFALLVLAGVCIYALNAILLAVELGYDWWGRLVLGFLQGLGGGTVRDFLIGGDRLPPGYTRDPVAPAAIVLIVIIVSVLSACKEDFHKTPRFQWAKKYADIVGFALMATTGAFIAIRSGMAWYWAPVCAVLTSAGGGALRDIASMKAPVTFQGALFEEVAILGGLLLPLGLWANQAFGPVPDALRLIGIIMIVAMVCARYLIIRYDLRYPKALLFKFASRKQAHVPLVAALGPLHVQIRNFIAIQAMRGDLHPSLVTHAAQLADECLIALSSAGRSPPTRVDLAFGPAQAALTLSYPGAPLPLEIPVATGPDTGDESADQYTYQAAIGILRHYASEVRCVAIDAKTAALTLRFKT